jgi:hypothetical protein
MKQESSRVLCRRGARALTPEEAERICGGSGFGTNTLVITGIPPILDGYGDFD